MARLVGACVFILMGGCTCAPPEGDSASDTGTVGTTSSSVTTSEATVTDTTTSSTSTGTTGAGTVASTGAGTDGSGTTGNGGSSTGAEVPRPPIVLYQGPAATAVVPDWDPTAPRPIFAYERELGPNGEDFWGYAAIPIAQDGSLIPGGTFDSDEIIIWGWDDEPPVLYDGTSPGALGSWDNADPYPPIVADFVAADGRWVMDLATVGPNGGLLHTTSGEAQVVWGWDAPSVDAPTVVYTGFAVNAFIPGWNPDDPRPILPMFRSDGPSPPNNSWSAALIDIDVDGTLRFPAFTVALFGW